MSIVCNGSNFGGRFLTKFMKLKKTCFFDIFVCQNFQSCEFDSVFHGLGSSEYGCCCFLSCGVLWVGMVWYGLVWYGAVCFGMVWYGLVWYGVVWCGVCGVVG